MHVIVVSLHFPRGSSAQGLTNISGENMGWRMLRSLNPYGIRWHFLHSTGLVLPLAWSSFGSKPFAAPPTLRACVWRWYRSFALTPIAVTVKGWQQQPPLTSMRITCICCVYLTFTFFIGLLLFPLETKTFTCVHVMRNYAQSLSCLKSDLRKHPFWC